VVLKLGDFFMAGGISQTKDIGELLSVRQTVAAQSFTGSSAVNGTAIDRYTLGDPQSCVLHTMGGALSGAPSSFTLTPQLQSAPDNGSGAPGTWAAYGSAGTALTAASTEMSQSIDLNGANRWIRAVLTPAFVGGTSPAFLASAVIVFGGAQELPATA
jgi:hypothetical protein